MVIGYLLLLWLMGVLLAERRQRLVRQAPRGVSMAIEYTVQTLLHGLLLFLLPIYYASTTLTSGNAWFLLVLVAAAILTTMDPWYRAATGIGFRWLESILVPHRAGIVRRASSVASVLALSCGSSAHSRGARRPTAAVGRVPSAGAPPGSIA